ncbi:MAG: hypothetical protein B7C24_13950 [Bacteroidetes bacterium 4572_77]|nr:MAG: hypothetical protein B7C24_13950 [Bacteroidetes bacterium 4572_77]
MAKSKNTNDLTEERFEAVEEALSKSEQLIEKHQKSIITVIGIVVLVVVAYFAFDKYYLQPLEQQAQIEMAHAENFFLDIIDEYGITKSANLAHYYAGICYLKLGEYETSIDYLKGFSVNDLVVAPMAMGAIADAYMELGETDKAINFYLDAANQRVNDFTSPLFLQKAAWAYESLGDFDKAIAMHKRISEEFANTTEGRDAKKYISYLEQKK